MRYKPEFNYQKPIVVAVYQLQILFNPIYGMYNPIYNQFLLVIDGHSFMDYDHPQHIKRWNDVGGFQK